MSEQTTEVRQALRQFLRTDALFGVSAVPIPQRALPARSGRSPAGSAPVSGPTVPAVDPAVRAERAAALKALDEQSVKNCTKCGLATTRKNTVFGQGDPTARLVFVGEAPGAEEDQQGEAFVGPAGQLLTRMIAAMGLTRQQVYICNVLKCRPPGNRTPAPDEVAACLPYLVEQLRVIAPQVIVALGAPAAQTLLQTGETIGRLRGRFHDCYLSGTALSGDSIPLMPTYHPAYLLRSPGEKAKVWQDLQMVMAKLGLPHPAGSGR